jgi:hypothetical protein
LSVKIVKIILSYPIIKYFLFHNWINSHSFLNFTSNLKNLSLNRTFQLALLKCLLACSWEIDPQLLFIGFFQWSQNNHLFIFNQYFSNPFSWLELVVIDRLFHPLYSLYIWKKTFILLSKVKWTLISRNLEVLKSSSISQYVRPNKWLISYSWFILEWNKSLWGFINVCINSNSSIQSWLYNFSLYQTSNVAAYKMSRLATLKLWNLFLKDNSQNSLMS